MLHGCVTVTYFFSANIQTRLQAIGCDYKIYLERDGNEPSFNADNDDIELPNHRQCVGL